MPNPSASPIARVCSPRAVPALFLLLTVLAFAWRMPYAATSPIVQVDEVKYSLPTVKRLLAGDPALYISG